MTTAQKHFDAGSLAEAITAAAQEVKSRPTDTHVRLAYAQLLCFNGDWQRADQQLDVVARQSPEGEKVIMLYRQLIRAEVARREFFREGRVPELLEEPTELLQAGLRLSISLRDEDESAIRETFEEYSRLQPLLSGSCDGSEFSGLRDLDDLLGPVLEVLTATGKYYWVPFERVAALSFDQPEKLSDLLWRHANVSFQNGIQSSVYLPVLYPGSEESEDDELRLGRATDWREVSGGPVRGIGQKMWLIGDDDRSVLELGELTIAPSAARATES